MKTNRIIQLAAGVLLLTACTSDFYEEYVNGRVPVSLGYEVLTAEESTRTAASTTLNDATIASGDNITVKIKNNGADASAYNPYNYTAGDGGAMNPPSPKPYYPTGSTNIDILAYYPANAASNFDVAADQTSDANYKASDLMVATVTNQARTTSTVALAFQHKMAKLVVTATAGEGVNTIQTITLKNVKRRVTFTNTSGAVGEATAITGTDVILFKSGTSTSGTGAALIPAQTITGNVLEIVTDQGTAVYNVPAGKAFAANTKYTITVTVNRTAVGATNTITWGSGENVTINPASTTQELSITIADQTYTGSALMPTFTIKDASGNTVATVPVNTASSYGDFNIYWQNNTNAGTATVAAVGKTGTDYAGKACAKNFTIQKKPVSWSISPTSLGVSAGATGTITVSRQGSGAVTAVSAAPSTASVSGSGTSFTVTGVTAGSTTVTFSIGEDDNYSYTNATCTATVTVTSATTLSALKAAINAGGDCSAYIGYEVNSSGAIASSGVSGTKIGYVGYVSTSDVDTGVSGSRILVLASADAGTSIAWGGYGTDSYTDVSYSDLKNTSLMNGYTCTQKLYTKKDTYTAAKAAWEYQSKNGNAVVTGSSGWFLPCYLQWVSMRDAQSGSSNQEKRNAMNSVFGLSGNYWSSTEFSSNDAYLLDANGGVYAIKYTKNLTYNVRACFAY